MRIQTDQQTLASGFTSFTQIPRNKIGRLRRVTGTVPDDEGLVTLFFQDSYTRQQPESASSVVTEAKVNIANTTGPVSGIFNQFIDIEIDDDIRFLNIPQGRSSISGAVITLAFDIGEA